VVENSDFLYPFIDSNERDATSLLADLARSARGKAQASAALRTRSLQASATAVTLAAVAIADRLAQHARMYFFGNGGSSTDAASLANLFARPPSGRAVGGRALVDDSAILTALGNDVGFDLIFSRQLIAHSRPGDIAVGLSTSGNSRNVLTALSVAAERNMLTIGIAGYNGGEMALSSAIAHCLVVDDDSVHRIQESQAALGFALWREVQDRLGAYPVTAQPSSRMG
jgi:D-sedoheptulose 7-phosphate isomerase